MRIPFITWANVEGQIKNILVVIIEYINIYNGVFGRVSI